MKRNRSYIAAYGVATLFAAMPALGTAQSVDLRRDQVIPVVFEDSLSVRGNREGDRFSARVDGNRELPSGVRFEGRIVGIRQARNNEPAMMDLEFTEIVMPDGSRHRIDAVPVPLNDRFTTRHADGRITAKKDTRRKGNSVLGGALGGFILGSIFQKQLEGVVLGTIAGIVIAETGSKNDGNVVIDRGARYGALINRDVRFDYRGDWRRDDWGRQDDWRREDDWRRNDDWRRDDGRYDQNGRYDDRWNSREPRITYRDRELRWDREKPYRVNSTIMVPLERAASQLDLRLDRDYNRRDDRRDDRWEDRRDDRLDSWNRDGRMIFVEGPEGYLELQVGSRRARLNNRSIDMPQAVRERDRVVYVPLEVLGQLARESVYTDGARIPRTRF